MIESTWTGVCVFTASLALRFRWQIVGKYILGKRISLEAQGLFRIRRNPPVADEQDLNHKIPSLLSVYYNTFFFRFQLVGAITDRPRAVNNRPYTSSARVTHL